MPYHLTHSGWMVLGYMAATALITRWSLVQVQLAPLFFTYRVTVLKVYDDYTQSLKSQATEWS